MSPPGTDATVQGSPSRSARRSQLVRHSPTIWSRVCSRKMWGWVREWLPMIWPDRRSERIPAASRKVRSPMRLVMMKKWPRQPRRASSSPTSSALLPPSSKVSTRCRPGAVGSIAVTSSGRSQQQHERGWDELPGRHHGPHLAGYERLGVAVLVVHPGYLRERIPGEVVGDHVGREQDAPPTLDQPGIELAVLIPRQLLIEQADPLERLAATAEERDRIDPARLPRTDAEVGVADAEGVRHRDRDRPSDGRLVPGHRDQHAPDAVCAGSLEGGDEFADVIRRVDDMCVHA